VASAKAKKGKPSVEESPVTRTAKCFGHRNINSLAARPENLSTAIDTLSGRQKRR
jgi:hypothetical protein